MLADPSMVDHCIISYWFGVSGILGIILSLALKYDGCSLDDSTADILVLLLIRLDSFNIFDAMKDDNKLLFLLSGCG